MHTSIYIILSSLENIRNKRMVENRCWWNIYSVYKRWPSSGHGIYFKRKYFITNDPRTDMAHLGEICSRMNSIKAYNVNSHPRIDRTQKVISVPQSDRTQIWPWRKLTSYPCLYKLKTKSYKLFPVLL